jgi:hypothetical protein
METRKESNAPKVEAAERGGANAPPEIGQVPSGACTRRVHHQGVKKFMEH